MPAGTYSLLGPFTDKAYAVGERPHGNYIPTIPLLSGEDAWESLAGYHPKRRDSQLWQYPRGKLRPTDRPEEKKATSLRKLAGQVKASLTPAITPPMVPAAGGAASSPTPKSLRVPPPAAVPPKQPAATKLQRQPPSAVVPQYQPQFSHVFGDVTEQDLQGVFGAGGVNSQGPLLDKLIQADPGFKTRMHAAARDMWQAVEGPNGEVSVKLTVPQDEYIQRLNQAAQEYYAPLRGAYSQMSEYAASQPSGQISGMVHPDKLPGLSDYVRTLPQGWRALEQSPEFAARWQAMGPFGAGDDPFTRARKIVGQLRSEGEQRSNQSRVMDGDYRNALSRYMMGDTLEDWDKSWVNKVMGTTTEHFDPNKLRQQYLAEGLSPEESLRRAEHARWALDDPRGAWRRIGEGALAVPGGAGRTAGALLASPWVLGKEHGATGTPEEGQHVNAWLRDVVGLVADPWEAATGYEVGGDLPLSVGGKQLQINRDPHSFFNQRRQEGLEQLQAADNPHAASGRGADKIINTVGGALNYGLPTALELIGAGRAAGPYEGGVHLLGRTGVRIEQALQQAGKLGLNGGNLGYYGAAPARWLAQTAASQMGPQFTSQMGGWSAAQPFLHGADVAASENIPGYGKLQKTTAGWLRENTRDRSTVPKFLGSAAAGLVENPLQTLIPFLGQAGLRQFAKKELNPAAAATTTAPATTLRGTLATEGRALASQSADDALLHGTDPFYETPPDPPPAAGQNPNIPGAQQQPQQQPQQPEPEREMRVEDFADYQPPPSLAKRIDPQKASQVPPEQLKPAMQETATFEQQLQDPERRQMLQRGATNILSDPTAPENGSAMANLKEQTGWDFDKTKQTYDQMDDGSKVLLWGGLGLGTIAVLSNLLSEDGGGILGWLMALLGLGTAAGAAAAGGLFGEGAQQGIRGLGDQLGIGMKYLGGATPEDFARDYSTEDLADKVLPMAIQYGVVTPEQQAQLDKAIKYEGSWANTGAKLFGQDVASQMSEAGIKDPEAQRKLLEAWRRHRKSNPVQGG